MKRRMILMFLLLVAMLIGCSDRSTAPSNDSDQSAGPSDNNNQATDSSANNDQEIFTHSFTKFDGSRKGNESQLILEYSVMDGSDYQMLELQKDDWVEFTIVSESGELDIILQKEEEDPIYQGTDIETSCFQVGIEEAGTYKATVTGKNAKGSVSIIKMEKD